MRPCSRRSSHSPKTTSHCCRPGSTSTRPCSTVSCPSMTRQSRLRSRRASGECSRSKRARAPALGWRSLHHHPSRRLHGCGSRPRTRRQGPRRTRRAWHQRRDDGRRRRRHTRPPTPARAIATEDPVIAATPRSGCEPRPRSKPSGSSSDPSATSLSAVCPCENLSAPASRRSLFRLPPCTIEPARSGDRSAESRLGSAAALHASGCRFCVVDVTFGLLRRGEDLEQFSDILLAHDRVMQWRSALIVYWLRRPFRRRRCSRRRPVRPRCDAQHAR